jgi:hypothetical protein
MGSMSEPELVADVCAGCGCLVEDWRAHERHHRDLGVLAAAIVRHIGSHQSNRLILGRGLTIGGGIPAAGRL